MAHRTLANTRLGRRDLLAGMLAGPLFFSAWLREARASGTSRVPKLKITWITATVVRNKTRYVRVHTDQGVYGTGETYDTVGAEEIVPRHLSPALAGRDPLEIEAIWYDLWTTLPIPGGSPPTFMRGLGGPYLNSVSAIDMALWDLAGRALGLPVYQLLGGRLRDKVAVYFHANTPKQAADVLRDTKVKAVKIMADGELDRMRASGKVATIFDPNKRSGMRLTNGEIDALANLVGSVREVIGADVGLAVDMHARLDVESGIELGRALERYRLLWLEEPVPSENPRELAYIRKATHTPIACGENVYTRYGFRDVLENDAASVIQPDVGKCGGITEARKIASMADTYYVPIATHGVLSPLGTMASAHFAATIPNFMILEWSRFFDPLANQIGGKLPYRDGYLEVPDTPGLGVDLNDDAVAEAALPGYSRL